MTRVGGLSGKAPGGERDAASDGLRRRGCDDNLIAMDRRLFLAAVAGLVTAPGAAFAMPVPSGPSRISLLNAHTGESFSGSYRDANGPIASAMTDLDAFLRDFHSGSETKMDVGVIDFLAAVLGAVGETKATILSAYRTPATNAMLARTMFGVAENSQHMYGRALDIHLGARLEDAMNAARTMKRGGVGWYPRSGFLHLDTGPVRNWTLDGRGFDGLLGRIEQLLARSGMPRQVIAARAHRPLTVKQRLTLHRVIAKAMHGAGGR